MSGVEILAVVRWWWRSRRRERKEVGKKIKDKDRLEGKEGSTEERADRVKTRGEV